MKKVYPSQTPEKQRLRYKEYSKRRPDIFEKARRRGVVRVYGLTLEQYEEMLLRCGYRCEVCGKMHEEKQYGRLTVDHNHKNGKIRGLLCLRCNAGLGQLMDNPQNVIKLFNYVSRNDSLGNFDD